MKAFNLDKLEGSFNESALVELNSSNWFSGDYQKTFEEYIVLNNHLSPFFIRLNNQIDYTLFNKVNVSQGVIGKEGTLYEQIYIDSYFGKDLAKEERLREYVKKIKFIQDTLQKLNKGFVYIQAPGKASFYPEYIPDSLSGPPVTTNYDLLVKLLDEYQITHIDFKPYFLKNKTKSEYPLFTRTGIHWSKYAMALVMDSINDFIEKDRNIDLANIYWDEIDMRYAQYEDRDLEAALNLLFPMYLEKYAYPVLKVEPLKGKTVPKVLMIGDSYLGNLYWGNYFEVFDPASQYWFYNNSVYSLSFKDKIHKFQLNQIDEIKTSDVIIIGCNEANIKGMSWNFIDKAYGYYKYGELYTPMEIEIIHKADSARAYIKERNLYSSEIKETAARQKISEDSALTVKAFWLLNLWLYNKTDE